MNEPEPQKIKYVVEGERFAFYVDGDKAFDTEEVAILFDKDLNVMHKHGVPAVVERSAAEYRARFRAFGLTGMADNLVVIQGRFKVKDLNYTINHCKYIAELYGKVMSGAVPGVRVVPEPVAEPIIEVYDNSATWNEVTRQIHQEFLDGGMVQLAPLPA